MIHPKYYPADDALASCVIIAATQAGAERGPVANAILRAIGAEERDIADPATLRGILCVCGLDAALLMESAAHPRQLDILNHNTREAAACGVFGSPFYFYGDEIFWARTGWIGWKRRLPAGRCGHGRPVPTRRARKSFPSVVDYRAARSSAPPSGL